ncbi:MAG: hypothetical protein ACO3CC_05145, partial [Alphaproteobacteria bacterium]
MEHLRDFADARALIGQRRHGDHPALALRAETIFERHPHVGEEHLSEMAIAGHVLDRPDLD